MNDEYSILPKEAFAPLSDVANNLINKISDATGYVFTPKGKQKDRNDAVEYFIEKIKENNEMPDIVKAAVISDARKIIKEYLNKNDILTIALEYLSDDSKVSQLEDDWLDNFFDKAGRIANKDVQLIFGKILAEECVNPGSASKSLVNILSVMDSGSAESFRKLRNYVFLVKELETSKEEYLVVIPDVTDLKEMNVTFDDIMELTRLGLIEYLAFGEYTNNAENAILSYAEKSVRVIVSNGTTIPTGTVNLTRVGQELASMLTLESPDYRYYNNIIKYWEANDVKMIKI